MIILPLLRRQRKLLMLALPMILSNITVPLLGLVDTAVLGHLERAYYLGGVAVGSMVIGLIYWLCGFLRMSTTGLVAQALGKSDLALARQQLEHSLVMAVGIALALLLLQLPLGKLAFGLVEGSEAILHYGKIYYEIRIWSAPATLVNMVLLGWLLAHQRVRWVVLQLVVVNLTNILLDLLLVVVWQWEVAGAAWASVIADYTGLALLIMVLFDRLQWQQWWRQRRGKRYRFNELLRLNRDIFVRSLALQSCFAFMTFQGARFGDVTVAANAILLNFLLLVSYALDGFAYAAESMVGQAWGRGERQRLNQLVWQNSAWCAMLGSLFAMMLWLWGWQWIAWLTDLTAVRQQAQLYLPWVIGISLIGWLCFLMDGVYIGLARGRAMRNSMLLASIGVFFPSWWLCQSWGNHGLWLAMLLFMLTRGLSLALDYCRFIKAS